MLRTILEELQEKDIPPEQYAFVAPQDVTVKTQKPKWVWVARVASQIPEGKCILLPVPEKWEPNIYAYRIRQNLSHTNRVNNRFSVRTSKDGKSIVVLKAETWAEYYERYHSQPA